MDSLTLLFTKEQYAHGALYNRGIVSDLLLMLFKKSNFNDLLLIWANCLKKRAISPPKIFSSFVFDSFPPFYKSLFLSFGMSSLSELLRDTLL